jgi:hypothetical protein
VARLKLSRGLRAGYRGWTRLPADGLPYFLEATGRGGIPRIVPEKETEAGVGPVIARIPAAVGKMRIGAGDWGRI